MRASFFRRAILVAVIAGLLRAGPGLGLPHRACAQSITVGTYNIRIAGTVSFGGWGIEDWIATRRFLVFESIDTIQPDLVGFQEAFARNRGVTQQTSLGEVFQGTKWEYLSWEAENEFNMNPIIVNTDRFSIVDSGTTTIDFQNGLTAQEWVDYFDLHAFFHGDERNGQTFVHFLGPERYVNWVVVDDNETGGRVAFLTSHYETFIGNNNKGAEYDDDYVYFSDLVNRSFGYASERIHAQAEVLRGDWGALGVVIGGDFETPDPTLPSQKVFEDLGYAETWRADPDNSGPRHTMGIDNLFVMPDDFALVHSDYDRAPYTNDASDHKPLYAELTQTVCLRPDFDCDGDVDLGDYLSFVSCFTGLGGVPADGCHRVDLDHDGDTDLADLLAFQAAFTGAK